MFTGDGIVCDYEPRCMTQIFRFGVVDGVDGVEVCVFWVVGHALEW